MPASSINVCQCTRCRAGDHPDKELHRLMNLFLSRLNEQQRRWYAAVESVRVGRGGIHLLSQITGVSEKTIRRGRKELTAALDDVPAERIRRPGGGRPRFNKRT